MTSTIHGEVDGSPGDDPQARSKASPPWHRVEYGEALGQKNPIWFVAQENCDRRIKEPGLIERPGVDRVLAVRAHHSTEDESSTGGAMVAHGVPAT
jgi:hypothetical protein